MLPADPNKTLADNVEALIRRLDPRPPRPQLAARMGIGDKTLGFIKAGTGNPTLENISKVARFFRVEPWELLCPNSGSRTAAPCPLDERLLARCMARAIALFRDASRLPSDEQIAAVTSQLYTFMQAQSSWDEAETHVRALLGAQQVRIPEGN